MTTDIFSFWEQINPKDYVHPADSCVLNRVNHDFCLDCLPGPYMGPLRKAKVVLLYLSPGWNQSDAVDALTVKGQNYYAEQRKGCAELPSPHEHPEASKWLQSRTKIFSEWKNLRDKIAVLNIGAYHSQNFNDHPLLTALPSCRESVSWAQSTLFPQALQGDRVVVCMRAARYWGLSTGEKYGEALYAPRVTPGGHMCHGELREEIIQKVKDHLNR